MPVTLRQRLDCHYCGQRSKQTPGKKRGGRFQCEHCLAVNFFDENGEIADVPLEEAAPAQDLPQPVEADPLADGFSARDSIFCSTCLKNQHIFNYTLSQYLPDPEEPDYDRLEAELPEYKKGLEQRYPQCCAKCEPRVRAQLQEATYNARSDHLRRVLEKSRQRRIASRWGWRSLLVNAAGLGYFASLTAQILWHLYGSQISSISPLEVNQPAECVRQRAFHSSCLDATEPLVGLSLVLGLLCVWWNPKWQEKLVNSEGRLIGLHQYYLMQLVLLGLRFSAWIIIFHLPVSLWVKAMLHACFAVALSVLAGWSVTRIVKVRFAPPINWHQDPAPLLTNQQFIPPGRSESQGTQPLQDRPFSVDSLAQPSKPTYQPWDPPTPPPDAADAMDWTPTQRTFQPQPKQVRYQSLDRTPFHGTLPALNARGVLKNNQNQKQPGREAIGLPPGFFDKPKTTTLPPRQTALASEAMAQPTFFGHTRESDTGLEDIFDSVFSLRDRSSGEDPPTSARTPKLVRDFGRHQTDTFEVPPTTNGASTLALFRGISIFFILIGLASWILEAALLSQTSQLGYYLVLSSTSIPIGHIMISLYKNGARNHSLNLFLYAFEATALIAVAKLREPFGDLLRDLWDKLAIGAVALLLPQEYLALNRSYSRSSSEHWNMAQNSAPARRESKQPGQTPISEPTMAEKSRAIMPGLVRAESNESIETRPSMTTDSDPRESSPWDSPLKAQNERFDYFDTMQPQTYTRSNTRRASSRPQQAQKRNEPILSSGGSRPATTQPFGLDVLMPPPGDGLSGDHSTGLTNTFQRNLKLSTPAQNPIASANPRRRL
ncbi:hypothetical protein G647_05974 [Cladophialophora carrionii CBS 160.54]|uniref:Ima1 N-terminal domain-containing protein n=1 Tax=Cladophialophora carrionii CBS 160.54 TaxID=1279043 RepID=V9D4U4_9EURO|nr:uncharacterized protein G647_05974 [Cladophialophora carrionii CBS 160.54]ETI21904.1 hypothetical protein G647_05974 [Cladophialophora carrionii CBS 160.54]